MNTVGQLRGAEQRYTSDFVQSLTGSQSRLYAYICSMMGEVGAARDVLQETNVVLWEKRHDYDSARPFLPWAYRFAHLQVLAYRKTCVRSRLIFDEQLVSELAGEVDRCDGDDDRRLDALANCMKELPGAQRELLDRRYRCNESVDRIAERLRKSPNVVSVCLYRLRKALLTCVESRLAVE